jgi:hypothetical protein
MKIGLVYFYESPVPGRKVSPINLEMLEAWTYFLGRSGTKLPVCMLTDTTTEIPALWPYEVIRLPNTEPPERRDVFNKVGWIKAQAFEQLGHCLIMDVDALPLMSLDPLADIQAEIAMVPDAGRTWEDAGKHGWNVDAGFGIVGAKHNAGVMILGSRRIWPMFQAAWKQHWSEFGRFNFFDEMVFSALRHKLGGATLPQEYNVEAAATAEGVWAQRNAGRVLHFRALHKPKLTEFYRRMRNEVQKGPIMIDCIVHATRALADTQRGTSKLADDVLNLKGYSSPPVRKLLNNLCSFDNCHFLEVGTYKGDTAIAASYRNKGQFVAVSDFSEYGGQEECADILAKHKKTAPVELIVSSPWEAKLDGLRPIDVLFYDGPHRDAASVQRGIEYFGPMMAEQCVVVVDDWNWEWVRKGVLAANPWRPWHLVAHWELFTGSNGDIESWWNGVLVGVYTSKLK